jgi:acyl carrier protein
MTEKEEKEKKVISIIRDILSDENMESEMEIAESTKLKEDLGFDSLMLAVLTVKIENEFDVDVFEDGLIFTVAEIFSKIAE